MKYEPDDLEDFIEEETICEITCSECRKQECTYGEAYYEKDTFFEKGWRATQRGNVYCPECASKKLKNK
jgi:hypothetical protein